MTPLIGYAPDIPATTPGAMVECTNFIPYEFGMRPYWGSFSVVLGVAGGPTTTDRPLGFAMIGNSSSTNRIYFATATKIYLYNPAGPSWTDVSRGGGYAVTASTLFSTQWSFAQFGSSSLAANIETTTQVSSGGAFADISGAPKAAVIESVVSSGGGFVIAFNTDDATYGTRTDAWWCCAANDVTSWAPSIAIQCATGRLIGAEGPIIAAKKFGTDMIVAYKGNAFYVGRYVGGDVVWQWQEYPGWGCIGPDAVANLGTAHFVVDQNGPYIFDGVRPFRVGNEVVRTFKESIDGTSGIAPGHNKVLYDRRTNLVWWFLPGPNLAYRSKYTLAYHLDAKMWGRADGEVGPVTIMEHADTAAGLQSGGPYGLYATGGGSIDYKVGLQQITSSTCSFRTNWFGDDKFISRLTECNLRYDDIQPVSASVQCYYSNKTGDSSGTAGPSSSYSDDPTSTNLGRFTVRQTARWHSLAFTIGPFNMSSILPRVIGFDAKLTKTSASR